MSETPKACPNCGQPIVQAVRVFAVDGQPLIMPAPHLAACGLPCSLAYPPAAGETHKRDACPRCKPGSAD
jgi:ribosomal protein S27AE